ncbi:Gfo/Idh/MocA family protein [Zavarzinella formosa]|uniref:Gfo/Idh/MocA family protein n=1 Tax=Zavarzinella formosa TaxID=360055 RepID=UPI0002FEB3D4|nr:Gfo/Idh/MocA family oxidoreductase [Zavarzinella formosa]
MSGPVRFALIGAGGIAQSYVQAFEKHPNSMVAAVVEPRSDAAQALSERLGCRAFANHHELLKADVSLDGAIVCTPPNTHEEIVCDLVAAKIHVLCEKPFTISSGVASKMLDMAAANHVLLTMSSKFRYVEDVIRLKSLIASGVLGQIVLLENAFTARVDMAARWNSVPEVSGGGVLIDNGTHSIDIIRYLLGPLAAVRAFQFPNIQKIAVEDTVQLFVKAQSGVPATIDLSWSINKELDHYLKVHGTQGMAVVGWKESRYRQHSARDWVKFGNGYDKVQAFRDVIGNFAKATLGLENLLIKSEDALASVQGIEAAYRSLREPHWMPIE